MQSSASTSTALKSYPVTWEGDLLLACRKCQKKLKRAEDGSGLAQLRKMLKKRGRKSGVLFKVIGTPCWKVCPKGGVVVCTKTQVEEGRFSVLRTRSDVDALCAMSKVL